jgi:hypothetical protein
VRSALHDRFLPLVFSRRVSLRHFEHGTPRLLFSSNGLAVQEFLRSCDVHPNGKRFLMLNTGGVAGTGLNAILNRRLELEKLTEASR